ncbi:MAG: MotA/TolQ/ExbB proton channel family protein, partial [Gemmatimonadaceae bacterium]
MTAIANAIALLQLGQAVPTTPWQMITHASKITQVVLVVLALLSLVSWAIMAAKWREFRAANRAGRAYMRDFERAAGLEEASALTRRARPSPFTRVFSRAVNFFAEMKPGALRDASASPLSGSQVEALRLVLDSETAQERDRLGHFIPWLATIGSASPLLGLLGT